MPNQRRKDKRQIGVWFEPVLYADILKIAKSKNIPMSDAVKFLCGQEMERIKLGAKQGGKK